jgi:hypothetical protein
VAVRDWEWGEDEQDRSNAEDKDRLRNIVNRTGIVGMTLRSGISAFLYFGRRLSLLNVRTLK